MDKDDESAPRLKYCSIRLFKGMESQVVILILYRMGEDSDEVEVDYLFDKSNARAYACIGMSRARGSLIVLANDGLRKKIEASLGS